jgi:hypothetical protein
MISCWWGNDCIYDVLECCHGGWTTSPYAFSNAYDDYAHDLYLAYLRTLDNDEKNAILKEHNAHVLPLVYELVMPTPVGSTFWWPWLKGYHGEVGLTPLGAWGDIPKFLWVDQDLKERL